MAHTKASINKQWLLAERPSGALTASTFHYHEAPMPVADTSRGEVLIKTLWLSFDPAMRGWMDDVPSYLPPVALGEPMRASAVAQVIESGNSSLPVGTLVMGLLGWQEYAVFDAEAAKALRVLPEGTPPSLALSLFGGTGMTAYFGLLDVGQPKAGETVLVSGAAGATGSVVCQIAKIKGCRVVGIAGGADKCQWLREACGVDGTIDYKADDIDQRLSELCPDGVDVFFDNVGGSTLETALDHMANFGRIALCGAISRYNDDEPQPGPRNMMLLTTRRLRMQGFIVLDYLDRADEFAAEMGTWFMEGKIVSREDVQEGFDNIPATLNRLFSGQNQGKQLLRLADPA